MWMGISKSARLARAAAWFAAGAIALAHAPRASAIDIADGELLPTSWTVFVAGSGLGGSASSIRQSSGGNPDSMRRITLGASASPNGATQSITFALHLRTGFVHAPATAGAIASISMTQDTKLLDAVSFPQSTGPLIRQDGVFYITRGANTGVLLIWGTRACGPYTAQDFVALDTSDPIDGVDESVQPNFTASGSPIEVGFYRALASGIGGGPKASDCGLDNLVITITTPAACVGDLNGDNAVNTLDLTAFLARFGTTVTPGGPGDFNNDGAVNTSDLTTFLGRFGGAC